MLYKSGTEGYANAGTEPYSEFFTAQAAQAFGIDHVPYALEEWKGRLASVCPLMHKPSTAFVPFWTAAEQSLPLRMKRRGESLLKRSMRCARCTFSTPWCATPTIMQTTMASCVTTQQER